MEEINWTSRLIGIKGSRGVGKTTLLGYLAHYYSIKGKKVLIISADDQNSIFKLFGCGSFVTENTENFFENYLMDTVGASDIVCEARENMYIIKTLNTDRLSFNMTVKRQEERKIIAAIQGFTQYFDYIFVDFPPSSSRLSEVLLDISDKILLVVGLDTLGLDGYLNTIQYFVDTDIDLGKIKYILPTGYHPVKLAPNKALKELKKQAAAFSYQAMRIQRTDFPVLTCATSKIGDVYRAVIGARPGVASLVLDAEGILANGINNESAVKFAEYVAASVETKSNSRGSAEYRKHLAKVLCERAINEVGGML